MTYWAGGSHHRNPHGHPLRVLRAATTRAALLAALLFLVAALGSGSLSAAFSCDAAHHAGSPVVSVGAETAGGQARSPAREEPDLDDRRYDDRSQLACASACPIGFGLAPQATREVILDTNAVDRWREAQGLLQAGDVPVITRTTQAEIRNLAAAGRMKPPGYIDDFAVIGDVMDVNTRINISGAMRPGQPDLFGDSSIGATAINRGPSMVTFDMNFADVLCQFGVNVL